MISDAMIEYLSSPMGILMVVASMMFSFVLFPDTTKRDEEDEAAEALKDAYLPYTPYKPKVSWSSDLQVLRAMWFSKITGTNLQDRLDSFYETQAEVYDSYRVRMLHGRPKMLQAVSRYYSEHQPSAAVRKKGLVWVDLACGTGYNMESYKTCLDKFSDIYLVDLCQPLCRVAQKERADQYNAPNKPPKIKVIHGDVTDLELKGLPPAGTVDLVTISYSLVMIPNWRQALDNAERLLKPGSGLIAVSDFTLDPSQKEFMKKFWTRIFESDHVVLDEAHLRTLHTQFDVQFAAGAYGTLPYTPVFLQPAYYYFLGTKKNKDDKKKTT